MTTASTSTKLRKTVSGTNKSSVTSRICLLTPPALVFAASVQHAEVLAAVLAGSGIPSASVAGYTPAAERRRLVERFRAGDVRILTNYNVLSQGFDAPRWGRSTSRGQHSAPIATSR